MYTVPVPTTKINQETRGKLGEAIYLLIYLIDRCNWEHGRLATTQEAIATETGIPLPTVKRWMQLLADAGEITTGRVPNGTLITILDYEAIARTRLGAKSRYKPAKSPAPRVSPAVREKTTGGMSKVSPALPARITGGPTKVSPTVSGRTAGGLNNININISKSKEQNFVQSKSPLSSCDEGNKAPSHSGRSKETPDEIFDYTDPWQARLAEVSEKLESMEPEKREALKRRALEEMAKDSRPFVRHFVRLAENSQLQAAGDLGEEMTLRRIWEITQREK